MSQREFTVWVQEANGEGTTHIQAYSAKDSDEACALALKQVAENWGGKDCGYSPDDDSLLVLGVAEGAVTILEWNNLNT